MENRQKKSKLSILLEGIAGWSGVLAFTTGAPAISRGLETNNDLLFNYGAIVSLTALTSIAYVVGSSLYKRACKEEQNPESLRLIR